MDKNSTPKMFGRYIVAHPKICSGKPTFRGTRIMVADVLEQVAEGLAWETIIEEWRARITEEAIAEAVSLPAPERSLRAEGPRYLSRCSRRSLI